MRELIIELWERVLDIKVTHIPIDALISIPTPLIDR